MTVATQLGRVVREICSKSRNPLILYTGRTAEIGGLLTELSGSRCADAVVFGGDDLTQLETTNFADLEGIKQYADGKLYFTTFAWTPGMPGIPSQTQQFFTVYEAARERHIKKAFLSGPNGHILLAYDAVTVVAQAAASRGSAREAVFQYLRTLSDFQGASGRLTSTAPAYSARPEPIRSTSWSSARSSSWTTEISCLDTSRTRVREHQAK